MYFGRSKQLREQDSSAESRRRRRLGSPARRGQQQQIAGRGAKVLQFPVFHWRGTDEERGPGAASGEALVNLVSQMFTALGGTSWSISSFG